MIGSTVGPYQIVDKLGVGGMGEVFLGHDPRLQRRVALKCLAAAPRGAVGDRILREARAVARLNHPHIAAVYDVLEHDDRSFIVMEYVEGESLAARLRRGAPTVDEIRSVGRQLASALAAAHAQGVVHRDLKPANVMIARDGSIKVLDFGVAKLSAPAAGTEDATGHIAPESTLEGNPGTPLYMSPEQLFDRPLDGRSDLYSAGVILYEMATGRRPYDETNAVALAMAIAKAPPPSPRSIVPSLPADLDAVIMRALERDADRRFQSARELETALTPPDGSGAHVAPFSQRLVARRAAFAAVVAVGVAAIGFGLTRDLWRRAAVPTHTVLAILPVDNPTGDSRADYIGAGIASVVAQNIGSIRGLTVLSRASTASYATKRQDLMGLQRDLGADYVLDVIIRSVSPTFQMSVRLRRPGAAAPDWEQSIGGDLRDAEQTLVDGLLGALQRRSILPSLSDADAQRARRVPTTSGDALMRYCEARALLDRPDVAGNIDRAVTLLQTATADDPHFALAFAALGDAYWQKYQRVRSADLAARATAAVNEALRLDPDQAAVHYSLGNMYQQTGRYEDAIVALRRAISIQPDDDESHALLARVLAAKGDYAGASDEAKRAVDIRPSWTTYFNQGRVEVTAGHLDKALTALRRTTELNPGFAGGFQMLGVTYQMMGDFDNAIGNYEHSIRLEPNAPAYSNLAMLFLHAKRYGEAITAFSEAVKRAPQSPALYRNLADAYKAAGRNADARDNYGKALALAQQALAGNARDAISIALVALCEANLGRPVEARAHALEAATIGAANADVHFRLTKVYLALNDHPGLFASLRAAVAAGYDPKAAREDDDLGVVHGAEFDEAIAEGLASRNRGRGRQTT